MSEAGGQPRRFRFGIQGRSTGPRETWLEMIRRVEDAGYSTFLAMDHVVRGLDPIASSMAAAMATTTLRVGSFVFANDFRHPVLLAKAAATIDLLSGGRFELGLGAGWLKEEYDQTGIPFDRAGIRIERMTEAIHLLKRLFQEEHPLSFSGRHYQITGVIAPPHPVQRPHPPLLIGGGSQRVLTIAGQEANIAGITTRAHPGGEKDFADLTDAATERKIAWVRAAAGDRFPEIELNAVLSDVIVTDQRQREAERLASRYGVTPAQVLASPLTLIGSIDEMVERLEARRQRFGFSYIVVQEPNLERFAPVVARLAGK